MNIVVLLSAGRHPASGAARPVPVELQAIALALTLPDASVTGLHAGPENRTNDKAVADALGHGLGGITLLRTGAGTDPLPALAEAIAAAAPDLVLAGRRGMGGADSGLLPYRLAWGFGMAIAADAMAIDRQGDHLAVVQSLPRGARRRLLVALPAVVTVHEAALKARPFVYRARQAGTVTARPGAAGPPDAADFDIRPFRTRPRLIDDGTGATGERQLMVSPTADAAAEAILAFVAPFRTKQDQGVLPPETPTKGVALRTR